MVKFATALRLGMAEAEEILRRFTRNSVQHPTYTALLELGKVQRTIFLCHYLSSEELRREIQEGLNVVVNWNSATNFMHFGRHGEFSTNKVEDQELAWKHLGQEAAHMRPSSCFQQYCYLAPGVTDVCIEPIEAFLRLFMSSR